MDDFLEFEKNTSPKVLIIEDEMPDTALIKSRVSSIWPASKIETASSIKQAYDIYRTNDFDLVLLDLNLPDGFGPQSVDQVRKFNRKVPIVVITGMGSDLTISEAKKMGASNVVLKSQVMESKFKEILEQSLQN